MPLPQSYTYPIEQSVTDEEPYHILVADDDPSIVHLLREDLEFFGHKVISAYDGQMALRMARQYHPDLVILDVNMPMTNGLKAFQALRGSVETADIPVIFVTAELSKDIYPLIAESPRVAHVKKPLDLESFNSLVQHFLEQYPTY